MTVSGILNLDLSFDFEKLIILFVSTLIMIGNVSFVNTNDFEFVVKRTYLTKTVRV